MSMLMMLAVLPAAILMYLVYRYDAIEKEPVGLVTKVFILGAVSTIGAMILETVGEAVLTNIAGNLPTMTYQFLEFFFVVAVSEELVKLLALSITRNNPAFNYTFDGIVYGVAAALGFAALENILYVVSSGSVGLAVVRGITAVPLHCTCGVFMGFFWGVAHKYRMRGNQSKKVLYLLLGYVVPVIIHGFYDFAVSSGSDVITLIGLAFTVLVFILAVLQVRGAAKRDEPLAQNIPAGLPPQPNHGSIPYTFPDQYGQQTPGNPYGQQGSYPQQNNPYGQQGGQGNIPRPPQQ